MNREKLESETLGLNAETNSTNGWKAYRNLLTYNGAKHDVYQLFMRYMIL